MFKFSFKPLINSLAFSYTQKIKFNYSAGSYEIHEKKDDIYLIPKKPNKHEKTLVWLHGLGDTARGALDIFISPINPVSSNTKVVLITAPSNPVTINQGMSMPSWYDIKDMGYGDKEKFSNPEKFSKFYSMKEVKQNTQKIQNVLDNEAKLLKSSKNLFLAGFSQGCAMCLHSGLEYQQELGGIFGFSGYLFSITRLKMLEKVPLYLFHGQDDPMIPLGSALTSYQRLKQYKNVSLKIFSNLEHTINKQELDLFKQYFLQL